MSMISRQKLIEELEERRSHMIPKLDGRHSVSIEAVIDYISKFPPADQWIPCSERPPEEPCIYTVEDCSPYTVNKHGEPQRRTIILKPLAWEPYHRVIAWKPINIEPYKGE